MTTEAYNKEHLTIVKIMRYLNGYFNSLDTRYGLMRVTLIDIHQALLNCGFNNPNFSGPVLRLKFKKVSNYLVMTVEHAIEYNLTNNKIKATKFTQESYTVEYYTSEADILIGHINNHVETLLNIIDLI